MPQLKWNLFCRCGILLVATYYSKLTFWHMLLSSTRCWPLIFFSHEFWCQQTVPRVSSSVFMFCAPWFIFGSNEGVGSWFQVLSYQSPFPRYRGCRVPFSCFCTLVLVFGGTDGVGYRFNVLCVRTRFRRYRGRRVPFSCFTLLESFSAVPRASGPVLMFYAPGLVFGGTKGVGSHFHVLPSQTRFRWCGGRRVQFSCFALPD
jgi:hypothetical protein